MDRGGEEEKRVNEMRYPITPLSTSLDVKPLMHAPAPHRVSATQRHGSFTIFACIVGFVADGTLLVVFINIQLTSFIILLNCCCWR